MNFAPFENFKKDNLNKFNPDKMKKKVRFSNDEKKKFYCETPGVWDYDKKWNVVDAESNLITPGVGTRQKTKMEMVGELHPNNYAIPVANVIKTENDEKFYYSAYFTGPGAGFGNLNVSSSIRVGDFTRTETKNFKAQKESELIDRWQFIDDRFATPENLVMELPRGGDSTRKPQIELSSMTRQEENREFIFKY
jgi:hypothetical protein